MLSQGFIDELDALIAAGPQALDDCESTELVERQLSRLEAFSHLVVARFDASGNWTPSGAKSAAAWLRTTSGLLDSTARSQVRIGRRLEKAPLAAAAVLAGEISFDQAKLIARARNPRTEAAFERDQADLVEKAKVLSASDLHQYLAYWAMAADPDGAEDQAAHQRDQRSVTLDETLDGTFFGRMVLDPIAGTIVSEELLRLEQQLFEQDRTEAKERLGGDPSPTEYARTPAQRRADALVKMAKRSAALPEGTRLPAPLFTVLVNWEMLYGPILRLARGGVLTPGSLAPYLSEANLERAVFGSRTRVEISEKSRLFTGATRRGVEVRDQRCQHPYCEVPYPDCEIDHIVPYAQRGPTTQENGRVLCGFHNRQRNGSDPPDPP